MGSIPIARSTSHAARHALRCAGSRLLASAIDGRALRTAGGCVFQTFGQDHPRLVRPVRHGHGRAALL
ncbi:MAG: hypothetical protein GC161_03265 [Planctomycetaceae bacterium]|nr:hypothetical protein [Planctomycetaceae bacterium]